MPDCTIAVIDDDALVRSATSSLIRSYGYSVKLFDSADAFLAARPVEAACVVTDLQMPGRSGLDLCRLLRAEGSIVPLILMTAYPTAEVRTRAAACDLTALLEKPLDPDRLATALSAALR